jgi:hypothetical protein
MCRIELPYLFISNTVHRFAAVPGPDGELWRNCRKGHDQVVLCPLFRPLKNPLQRRLHRSCEHLFAYQQGV